MQEHTAAAKNIVIIAICIIAVTAGMIISAFMLSRFMLKIQQSTEKSIKVKGVAEKEITSDLAAFNASISVKAVTKADGYAQLDKASKILCRKLDSLGFKAEFREDESISCSEAYITKKFRENGREVSQSVFDHYDLAYSVRIRTKNARQVAEKALKIYELAALKYDVEVTNIQYFINNPEQYKLELVDQASAAAAERARTAARQSGSTLGPLMTARQGVIQITSPASNETSDYGVYNTSSLQKVIRLVMTMEFELK